jgi:5-methyltetrahydrofolate--homocysteine methyltransferase
MREFSKLYDAILNGEEQLAVDLTKEALKESVDPVELINKWMVPATDEAGRRFEAQDFFFPELLMAGRAMKAALDVLRPALVNSGAPPAGRVAIGTVQGDLHDIGKNMVASMLEGAGFEVIDIGIDAPPEKFVEAVKNSRPNILGISALLTTTMPEMKKVINALVQSGLRDNTKVIVGGAPVTQEFANEIGADGYGENAASAVTLVRSLIKKFGV